MNAEASRRFLVTVLDPQHGERRLPREDFQEAWSAMRFLTIVIGA
jgi:predicted double-glycine peptidase